MAITPIHGVRVSLQLQSRRLLEAVRASQFASFTEQSRLASGRRFLVPSDDPVAANRSLRLSEVLDQQSRIFGNITHASNVLDATDDALTDVSGLLTEAHTLASQNVGSLTSADERAATAELIASIREQLMLIGNRQFDGRYLFAGRDTTERPFVSTLGGIAYVGDTGDVLARVADADFEPINLTGDVLFGALASRVSGSVDLDPVVAQGTRLEDLAGANGLGVRPGGLVFNEATGAGVVQVDLAEADTLGDVVDLINAAANEAGAGFSAALTPTGLTVTPGPALSITDTSTGVVASDLGILTDPAVTTPIIGADLDARLTRTTLLSDLAGGAGLDLSAPLRIANGSESESIDLSAAESVQDVLNEISNAGLWVRAEINAAGTGIDVINLISGTRMNIAEDGGTTAEALGIRSLDESTPLPLLNYGTPLETAAGDDDIRIVAKDGSLINVNLDGAGTLGDAIDLINQAATDAGVALTASLTDSGDGWTLVDATGGSGVLSVYPLNDVFYAAALGLNRFADPAATELVMNDLNTAQSDNVLAVLFDLEEALLNDDTTGITLAGTRLSELMEDVNRRHGVVGARAKAMQDRMVQTENANAATEIFLSQAQDLDYAEAATHFEQAQMALQASLLTGSKTMSLSLMDFVR